MVFEEHDRLVSFRVGLPEKSQSQGKNKIVYSRRVLVQRLEQVALSAGVPDLQVFAFDQTFGATGVAAAWAKLIDAIIYDGEAFDAGVT